MQVLEVKPDSSTHAIVAAIRKVGASWEYHEGSAGSPDGIWGYRGRMGWAEVKVLGKEHGVCGCRHYDAATCSRRQDSISFGVPPCKCKGHTGTRTAGQCRTWHRQLAWHEAWQGQPVAVWTTVEEALATVLGEMYSPPERDRRRIGRIAGAAR